MSEISDRPSVLPYSELRSIQEQLILIAHELPDRISSGKLRGTLLSLAERLDREIAITPSYTGDGNDVIRNMIQNLANEMYGKMEALAGSVDQGYRHYCKTGDEDQD